MVEGVISLGEEGSVLFTEGGLGEVQLIDARAIGAVFFLSYFKIFQSEVEDGFFCIPVAGGDGFLAFSLLGRAVFFAIEVIPRVAFYVLRMWSSHQLSKLYW